MMMTGQTLDMEFKGDKMTEKKSILVAMANRYNMEPRAFEATVKSTVMPAQVGNEQFAAFLLVANEYNLNPITREIYAFPTNGGGIQPIVSIDGWLKIINSHPAFDGMEFEDHIDNGKLVSVTCKIHRKDRAHPTEVTEYMEECKRNTEPWKKWPARMLRHKATIQAARYAFGFSGIADPDEAERMIEAGAVEQPDEQPEFYPDEDFQKNFPLWKNAIQAGSKTPDEIIALVRTKGELTPDQIKAIKSAAVVEAEVMEEAA